MTSRRQSDLLDAALAYAERGWAVFPCHSPVPGGCSCRSPGCPSPGKHPRVAKGLHAASTDPATIRGWWQRWPGANVAIRTGAVSGLVVIDVDPPHGGDHSLASLGARHGPLPTALTVRTGSGGTHIYLAHPGVQIRNAAGTRLGTGIDVRGDGGYVIAPPSRHPSGAAYAWGGPPGLTPPAPPPDWLVEHLRPPQRHSAPTAELRPEPGASSAWARTALEREIEFVRSAPIGQRNATLNRAAFCLGQIVAGGGLDVDEVEALLLGSASGTGLGEREARLTIASGITAGSRSPRLPAARRIGPPRPRASPAPDAWHHDVPDAGLVLGAEPRPLEVEL